MCTGIVSSDGLSRSLRARDHLMPPEILEAVRTYQAVVDDAIATAARSGVTIRRTPATQIAKDLGVAQHWVISAINSLEGGS